MGRAGTRAIAFSLCAGIIALASAGCGNQEDATLNLVRVELKNGNTAAAIQLMDQAKRHPDDLVDVTKRALGISDSNWQSELSAILADAKKSDASARLLEERAQTEGLDNRSARRMRAIVAERDLAFERLAAFLNTKDAAALSGSAADVVDATLLANKALEPTTQRTARSIIQKLGSAAFDPLNAALSSDDAAIRAGAIKLLGESGDERAVAAIDGRIGIETDFVALYKAPLALAHFDTPAAVRALARTLELDEDQTYVVGSSQARAEAVEQLRVKLIRNPALISETIPVLLLRLGDDNSYVVQRAHNALVELGAASVPPTFALAQTGWRTLPMSIVARVDEDREKDRRNALWGEAISVLIDLREPTVMSDEQRRDVIAVLDDALDNEDLRGSAAGSLRSLGGYALSTLIARLDSDDIRIRVTAAQSLGAMADLRAGEPIITRIENEREPEVLVAMIGAMQAMRVREAIPVLTRVIGTPRANDPRVQDAIASAMGRIHDATTYPAEIAATSAWLRDLAVNKATREGVRNTAIVALGEIKPGGVTLDLRSL
ncbi:MAG: hypothetical protein O3A46_16225, partial [Candidatus Poribacteria bacterium]|nr:hypothetical protein [Candidatus Poribacteria bacterium]